MEFRGERNYTIQVILTRGYSRRTMSILKKFMFVRYEIYIKIKCQVCNNGDDVNMLDEKGSAIGSNTTQSKGVMRGASYPAETQTIAAKRR